MADKVITTFGLPITNRPEDKRLVKRFSAYMLKHNIRARTQVIRLALTELFDRAGV